jgi:hypothetical protein
MNFLDINGPVNYAGKNPPHFEVSRHILKIKEFPKAISYCQQLVESLNSQLQDIFNPASKR